MIGTKTDLSTTRALMDLCGAVGTLPLYRMYRKDLRFFGKTQVEQFVVGEPRNALAEFVLDEDPDLVNFAQRTPAELAEIQNRWWKRKGPEEGTSGPADAGAAFEALCERGKPGGRPKGGPIPGGDPV